MPCSLSKYSLSGLLVDYKHTSTELFLLQGHHRCLAKLWLQASSCFTQKYSVGILWFEVSLLWRYVNVILFPLHFAMEFRSVICVEKIKESLMSKHVMIYFNLRVWIQNVFMSTMLWFYITRLYGSILSQELYFKKNNSFIYVSICLSNGKLLSSSNNS